VLLSIGTILVGIFCVLQLHGVAQTYKGVHRLLMNLGGNKMNAEIIPSALLDEILVSLKEVKEKLNFIDAGNLSERWLDIQEVCLQLKISKRTLQSYRDERILSFSQIAGKIYFKASDIEALLEKHYKKSLASRR